MTELMILVFFVVYVLIGVIFLSAIWREGDEFDEMCILFILTWPASALMMLIVGIIALVWNIGKLFRRFFK